MKGCPTKASLRGLRVKPLEWRLDYAAAGKRWRQIQMEHGGNWRHTPRGGLGFANPDNLAFDPSGALWMVTDIGTKEQNDYRSGGEYGNNACWVLPTGGSQAGKAFALRSARWNRNSPVRAPALMAAAFYSPCNIQAN
ncbi:alkaline phosphatase PhoX [Synechococcus lacustris Tous-12m]